MAAMEPLLVREHASAREELADLVLKLTESSIRLKASLPAPIVSSLADLVRSMNCYYSNLIEGHDTHPIDIERALKKDFSTDPKQRDLQLEARAHISVQAWVDEGGLDGRATTAEGILEIHQRFCAELPDDLLWVVHKDTDERERVLPGEYRQRDVIVGRHIPVSAGALPRFMSRFEESYAKLGKMDAIQATASAHHRLLWLHPFIDGNGRVARLMSYAMLKELLGTGGLWSIARGLARNETRYKEHLAACDYPRQGDLDGRGNLSERSLVNFTKFWLETCIDQVAFMEGMMEPRGLKNRVLVWCEEEVLSGMLPARSPKLLELLVLRGDVARAEVKNVLGVNERTAQRVTRALQENGIIRSSGQREPWYLAFPATLASRWMPGLFPDRTLVR